MKPCELPWLLILSTPSSGSPTWGHWTGESTSSSRLLESASTSHWILSMLSLMIFIKEDKEIWLCLHGASLHVLTVCISMWWKCEHWRWEEKEACGQIGAERGLSTLRLSSVLIAPRNVVRRETIQCVSVRESVSAPLPQQCVSSSRGREMGSS